MNDKKAIVVNAEFVRQVNIFTDLDPIIFDAAPALDKLSLATLPENAYEITENGALDYGDDIYRAAVSIDLIEEWDGPYRITTIDVDAYRNYLAQRKKDEAYGGQPADTTEIPKRNATLKLNPAPWEQDILWVIADIFRTSPLNPNYPHGYDCNTCKGMGIECTCDSDGWECNFAFAKWLQEELVKRGFTVREEESQQ